MTDLDSTLRGSRALLAIVAGASHPCWRCVPAVPRTRPARPADPPRWAGSPNSSTWSSPRSAASSTVSRARGGRPVAASSDSRREVLVTITPRGSRLVQDVSAKRQPRLDHVLDSLAHSGPGSDPSKPSAPSPMRPASRRRINLLPCSACDDCTRQTHVLSQHMQTCTSWGGSSWSLRSADDLRGAVRGPRADQVPRVRVGEHVDIRSVAVRTWVASCNSCATEWALADPRL